MDKKSRPTTVSKGPKEVTWHPRFMNVSEIHLTFMKPEKAIALLWELFYFHWFWENFLLSMQQSKTNYTI